MQMAEKDKQSCISPSTLSQHHPIGRMLTWTFFLSYIHDANIFARGHVFSKHGLQAFLRGFQFSCHFSNFHLSDKLRRIQKSDVYRIRLKKYYSVIAQSLQL